MRMHFTGRSTATATLVLLMGGAMSAAGAQTPAEAPQGCRLR